eukprot:3802642-Prymnesium_polylepis.1
MDVTTSHAPDASRMDARIQHAHCGPIVRHVGRSRCEQVCHGLDSFAAHARGRSVQRTWIG